MHRDLAAEWGEWDVEGDDFGGYLVRHRHWDGLILAFVHNDPSGPWAECSDCGAILAIADSEHAGSAGRQLTDDQQHGTGDRQASDLERAS